MTPKEKALELVDKFMEHTVEWDQVTEYAFDSEYHAKQCALIAVDEILSNKELLNHLDFEWWSEVKQEINNL
jgi:hypothetical protein